LSHIGFYSSEKITISQRNFDPSTRTLRKYDRSDAMDEEDTVEKNVAGVAEEVIAAHEETRAQELVGSSSFLNPHTSPSHVPSGLNQHST
jgi:hypothetical protein